VDVSDNMRPKLTHQKSFAETAGQIYGKTMTVIKTQDYSGWWQKFIAELKKLREDWWGTLKNWFGFLFSLAKPVEDLVSSEDSSQKEKEEKHKAEISNVVEKVRESGRETSEEVRLDARADASKTFSLAGGDSSKIAQSEDVDDQADTDESVNAEQQQDEATISLGANFDVTKSPQDMTQFEKLEQKLLNRLQESGLKNYDIWIQLGDFYLKYDERDKAKEIFALVLKQAGGEQKEIARNRLISF
jgi:Tfp pilus assembly protein FimV